MTWADATLSTLSSLERWERDINDLALEGSNWEPKIEASKELLGNKIELFLTQQGISVDESEGEVLLDVINNPEKLGIVSDYLTIYKIYKDLSNGDSESVYGLKAEKYRQDYIDQFNQDIAILNWDYDLDGEVDEYKKQVESYTLQI